MKTKSIISGLLALALLSGCSDEKELVVFHDNLPINTNELFIVGDASPVGWNMNKAYPLEKSEEDPYIFTYHGELTPGTTKLCMEKGTLDCDFIRPLEDGREIGKEPIVNEAFQKHPDRPDEKWTVVENGIYTLTFNLRDWTMSSVYEGPVPAVEPGSVDPEHVYMLGGAPKNGWNITYPTEMKKTGPYKFVYEGYLKSEDGRLKMMMETDNWSVPFIRPAANGVKISAGGVEESDFIISRYPDNEWIVVDEGYYRIELDFKSFRVSATPIDRPADEPIETNVVYAIGWATSAQWNIDNAIELEKSDTDKYVYTFTAMLRPGEIRFCSDSRSWESPMFRPITNHSPIGPDTEKAKFDYRSGGEDTNWMVTEHGIYTITLNLRDWTIDVQYSGIPWPEVKPIETETVYLLGATPDYWDINNPTPMTKKSKYIFEYEGHLRVDKLEAMVSPGDWFAIMMRPKKDLTEIGPNGVESTEFTYTSASEYPDFMWKVSVEGKYRITLDLEHWTINTVKLN